MLNEKKFLAIYDDFLVSGLTTRDYCANQQITENKFYYWQNKLKGQLPPKSGFVPMVFKNEKQLPSNRVRVQGNQEVLHSGFSCEINYPNGVCVKLSGLPEVKVLQSLLVLTDQ